MLKTGRGPKKLLGLLIGEIQNNDHKAIILFSFVVCIRRQGGGGGVCKWFRGGSLSDDSQVLGRLSPGLSAGRASWRARGRWGPRLRNCLYFSGKDAIRSRASQC